MLALLSTASPAATTAIFSGGPYRFCNFLLESIGKPNSKNNLPPSYNVFIETERLVLAYSDTTAASLGWAVLEAFDLTTGSRVGKLVPYGPHDFGVAIEIVDAYQKNGYGFESKLALLSLGFTVLNQKRSVEVIEKSNFASRRLHEKLGYELVKRDPELQSTTVTYILKKDDFRRLINQLRSDGISFKH